MKEASSWRSTKSHATLPGRLVMVGCGSIGQAILPLVLRHLGVGPDRITIVTADSRGRDVAAHYGVEFREVALTPENYRSVWSRSSAATTSC
jgi:homospermidine synthase